VTPSVTAQGDTNVSDATETIMHQTFFSKKIKFLNILKVNHISTLLEILRD